MSVSTRQSARLQTQQKQKAPPPEKAKPVEKRGRPKKTQPENAKPGKQRGRPKKNTRQAEDPDESPPSKKQKTDVKYKLSDLPKKLPSKPVDLADWLSDRENVFTEEVITQIQSEFNASVELNKVSNSSQTMTDIFFRRLYETKKFFDLAKGEEPKRTKKFFTVAQGNTLDQRGIVTFKMVTLVVHFGTTDKNEKRVLQNLVLLLTELVPLNFMIKKSASFYQQWNQLFKAEAKFYQTGQDGVFVKYTGPDVEDFPEGVKRFDGTEITTWSDFKENLFGKIVRKQQQNESAKVAAGKQRMPVQVRLDEVESLYHKLMKLVFTKDTKTWNPANPEIEVVDRPDSPSFYKLSKHMHYLGFLLMGCVGSRYKGLMYTNKIHEIPFEMNSLKMMKKDLETLGKSTEGGEDEIERSVKTWLNMKLFRNDNLVLVSGLSKQKGEESRKRQDVRLNQLNNNDKQSENNVDEDDEDSYAKKEQTIVKPIIALYLTASEFVTLFHQFRRAAMYCLYSRLSTFCKDNDEACKKEKRMFLEDKTHKAALESLKPPFRKKDKVPKTFILPLGQGLTTEQILPLSVVNSWYVDEQTWGLRIFKTFLKTKTEEKDNLLFLLKNGTGIHVLRKLYTVFAFHLYAKNTVKEVAFSQQVLGHKDIGVSLRYTDIVITMPTQMNADIKTWLSTHMDQLLQYEKDMKSRMKELTSELAEWEKWKENGGMIDRAAKVAAAGSFPRIGAKRHTKQEIAAGDDVKRVLDTLEEWLLHDTWPPGEPLSQKNMIRMGLGAQLRQKVRATERFKKLRNENSK